jgi:hypothetical protein
MALSVFSYKGVIGYGVDTATGERGMVQKMTNKTGSATVKGTLVSAATGTDNAFILQANEFDTIGVVAEAGVADASQAWIWLNGSIAQVLFKDTVAATRGYVCIAADTDGRAIDLEVPNANPVVAEHFKECGHILESKDAGTNVLGLAH